MTAVAVTELRPPAAEDLGTIAALREENAQLRALLSDIEAVCARAAKGDLEARLLRVCPEESLQQACDAVNRVLDVSDAFVREARAALEHAREAKFYRRVILTGMPGSYRYACATINACNDAMREQHERLQAVGQARIALANRFESEVSSHVATLASSATEMEATANSLTSDGETGDSTLGRLQSRADRVGRISGVIGQIASTTRLLALNATIEAARAGEAGRGFAVVAGEVKQLATSVATSTSEIAENVRDVQSSARAAVESVSAIATVAKELSCQAEKLDSAVRGFLQSLRS